MKKFTPKVATNSFDHVPLAENPLGYEVTNRITGKRTTFRTAVRLPAIWTVKIKSMGLTSVLVALFGLWKNGRNTNNRLRPYHQASGVSRFSKGAVSLERTSS